MRLQLASEGELEHYPHTRQGGGDIERVHAMNQQDGRPQYNGQDGRPPYNGSGGGGATGGGGKWDPSKPQ